MKKSILLINPWIYDFAAYDFWAKPLGLLYIASILQNYKEFNIHFIDCTDRYFPDIETKDKKDGTGKYHTEEVPIPECLRWMNFKYKRYGIPLNLFEKKLNATVGNAYMRSLQNDKEINKVDACLITSRMTYWYPGVLKVIELIRKFFGSIPIILGGVYPTLCKEHSQQNAKADFFIYGEGEEQIIQVLNETLNLKLETFFNLNDLDTLPLPAFEFCYNLNHLPIITSRGCPKKCTYCASRILFPKFRQRSPEKVAQEIYFHHKKFNTKHFAFYDDALLINYENHFEIILDQLLKTDINCNFHTPNGLYAPSITLNLAKKMYQLGFKNLRLSLETADAEHLKSLKRDVFAEQLKESVQNLKKAGFDKSDIGIYIMLGLPEQTEEEVIESINFIKEIGASPKLTEYSPLPHTEEWDKAVKNATLDITNEPLLHNNSVYHFISRTLSPKSKHRLKKIISNETTD